MEIQEIKVPGGRNIRDLGQYITTDGKKMKKGVLIRSARLDKMKPRNRNKFLESYNINTVIDFRNDIEIKEGNEVILDNKINHLHIPILSKAFFGISHEKKMSKATYKQSKENKDPLYIRNYMVNMYKDIVFSEYSQEKFKEFFDVILNSNGPVLYHCTGGKDRTGMASMFILSILGVSKEDILNDYTASDIFNKRHNFILQTLMNLFLWVRNYKKLLSVMLYSKRYYMEETIKAIEDKFGSIINYLEDVLGIDKSKQEKLKRMLLE